MALSWVRSTATNKFYESKDAFIQFVFATKSLVLKFFKKIRVSFRTS